MKQTLVHPRLLIHRASSGRLLPTLSWRSAQSVGSGPQLLARRTGGRGMASVCVQAPLMTARGALLGALWLLLWCAKQLTSPLAPKG